MGNLQFDSSIREFNHRASRTILNYSPLARIFTGLMNIYGVDGLRVFFLVCCSFLRVR